MILKFLWWFLNSCAFKNHFWNHKNLGHVMPAGAVGAVRPVGAILPTAFAACPFSLLAADGYAAPKAPAGQPCLDDELFPWLTTPIRHWPEQKRWMITRQITMSLENVTTLAGQVNTDPVRHSCRIDKSPLIFDPLGNGSPVLHIDNQKVSRLNECQEAGS